MGERVIAFILSMEDSTSSFAGTISMQFNAVPCYILSIAQDVQSLLQLTIFPITPNRANRESTKPKPASRQPASSIR